ncbi:hypothetical protein DUT91_11430 [Phyllobacterium salinisoli]|uniref:Alkaline proteinase inhibitor/ Outer membrane lipoprotein Omp19 domain-containing protein n=1 Tax=Phyllobacterium salinisoli TaxID=1899321 RepID=A0A368K3V3_9HYPH|nr:hypothetical protein [Phyllobacterium salinisoli]RCS23874.1 hypothetical protein DUT91_11430 [Phyllobacterium salinisoli]
MVYRNVVLGGLVIGFLCAGFAQSGLFSAREDAAETGIDFLTTASIAPLEAQRASLNPETFVLASAGEERICLAHAEKRAAGQSGALNVEADCLAVYPRLLQAVVWQRHDDGSIVFHDRQGRAVIEFAEGDGLQYESIEPGEVLVSMSALGVGDKAVN